MVGTLQLVFPQCSKMELAVVHVFRCVDILFFFPSFIIVFVL